MQSYPITKVELSVNATQLQSKSANDLKRYIDDTICPVILSHLITVPKGGEAGGRCTADRDGVRCEGHVSIRF